MSGRVIVAGSRRGIKTAEVWRTLDRLHASHPIGTVISGACPTGVDAAGEAWARRHGIPVERYSADWSRGRRAGPERNRRMAREVGADRCVVIHTGTPGSRSMIREAELAGLPVEVVEVAYREIRR
jgi:hypothetical protein